MNPATHVTTGAIMTILLHEWRLVSTQSTLFETINVAPESAAPTRNWPKVVR